MHVLWHDKCNPVGDAGHIRKQSSLMISLVSGCEHTILELILQMWSCTGLLFFKCTHENTL